MHWSLPPDQGRNSSMISGFKVETKSGNLKLGNKFYFLNLRLKEDINDANRYFFAINAFYTSSNLSSRNYL